MRSSYRRICQYPPKLLFAPRASNNSHIRDIPLVLFAYSAYKLVRNTKIIPLQMIPIQQAIDEADNDPENVPITRNNKWSKLNILWG